MALAVCLAMEINFRKCKPKLLQKIFANVNAGCIFALNLNTTHNGNNQQDSGFYRI
jgi:hypothetical protein